MNDVVRIKKNYIYSVLSISSRLIANVIIFWMMARYYGPKTFGQLTFAHTLATTFILFADFGFDVLLTNELARGREKGKELFQRYFSLKIIFTTISLASMWLFILITDVSSEMKVISIIFSLYMVFTTQSNFLFAFFRGYEKFNYETKISLLMNFSLLILVIVLILYEANILLIGISFVFSRFIGLLYGVITSFKIIPNLSYKLIFTGFKELKSKVFVYGFHFLFSYLFFQLDTILLAIWKNEFEVGIYQSVYKLIMLPLVVPDIFVNTLLPTLSKYYVEDAEKWKSVGKLMSKSLLFIIIPFFLIMYVFSSQVIGLIYGGEDYVNAVPILEIFSLTLFIRFLLEPFALMITTSNRQSIRLITVISATIINFVLNYFAIPLYGAVGAAMVSLITNLFVAIVYLYFSWSLFKSWLINLRTIVVVSVVIIIASLLKQSNDISMFWIIPVLFIILPLVGYFYFSEHERKLIIFNKLDFSLFNK